MFFSIVKSDTDPDTLANISLNCICQNLKKVFDHNKSGLCLEPGMMLPKEICEALIEEYQRLGYSIDDKFANIFADNGRTTLQKVTIWNSSITDDGIENILKYNLRELDLAYCKKLTPTTFSYINKYGKNLKSLSLGTEVNIIIDPLKPQLDIEKKKKNYMALTRRFSLSAPNLTRLVLRNIQHQFQPCFYEVLLLQLPKLTHLDLSCCNNLGDLSFIENFPNLISLVLFNSANLQQSIPNICRLNQLRHLDISQAEEGQGEYENANQVLKSIVESLPNLTSLDISGTNLAGKGNVIKDLFDATQQIHSDIPGLASRSKRPLEFLGLYGTSHRACKRHDIPAIKVSGDSDENQLLTAGVVYMHRPQMLQRVLNDLFHFLRADSCVNINKILQIILEGLNTHAQEKFIQISGSAALFYIVRNKHANLLTVNMRNLIINTLINSMQLHRTDETMLRNGCLTLCQFRIPQDILFKYNTLVELLLHIIMEKEQEGFVQRIGIYLMNSLACQVNDSQKEILGNLGIIEKMLTLIHHRIEKDICDDVMEVAWSTMWNVTDETPINCQRFLKGGGMSCFMSCLDRFHERNELMRNMMGLLGNVAEVQELRSSLMQYVKVFYDLLDSFLDGIEVSYNAAGVISHIASDGQGAWHCEQVERIDVLRKMVSSIERWNLRSERNINYHSFEPILKLTRIRHTPECQHWAIWALANLTSVYPDKYCPILEAEGGLMDVQAIIDDTTPYDRIKELANMVMNNYRTYKEAEQQNQNREQNELMNTGE